MQKIAISAISKRPAALLLIALSVALFGDGLFLSRSAAQQSTKDLLRRAFAQSGEANDAAAKAFRTGRELIEQERWPEAAKRFAEIVTAYPRHSNIDMALYWEAFALKKQGKLKDADTALARII